MAPSWQCLHPTTQRTWDTPAGLARAGPEALSDAGASTLTPPAFSLEPLARIRPCEGDKKGQALAVRGGQHGT